LPFRVTSTGTASIPTSAKEPVPAGKAKIVADFVYDGKKGELGKGGAITIAHTSCRSSSAARSRRSPSS
jgi:hypothetical protein